MSELLVVGHDDVKRLLPMEECIELMASVLADLARGAVWQPLRFVVRPPDEPSLMGLMPAHRSEPTASYGLKAVCIFPSNAARGIDLHQGGVLLFDGETGVLRALVDASAITATAPPRSRRSRRGCWPARTPRAGDPRLGRAGRVAPRGDGGRRAVRARRVWSRTAEHAAAFAAEAEAFPVEAVESAEEALRAADVVVTATSSPRADRAARVAAPGAHVNAVGSSIPTPASSTPTRWRRRACSRRARVDAQRGRRLPLRRARGGIGPDHIRAELGECSSARARAALPTTS
jgi:ornithine cyclodeaminase